MISQLNKDNKVRDLARSLGMKGKNDAVAYVVDFCAQAVKCWVAQFAPKTLDELLQVVLAKVGLVIEEIRTDRDITEICNEYVGRGEPAFARIKCEFDDDTFALVIRLRMPKNGMTHVAIIDCRGSKASKRWFSIWHEIAHLLVNPQLSFEFRRCDETHKDPIESLMDKIAGDLAFYAPMYEFQSVGSGVVTLRALEEHRLANSPDASRQSAFSAIVRRLSDPAVFVVCDLALKIDERRRLGRSGVPGLTPIPKLRAVAPVGSDSARQHDLYVPKNMRIPAHSVIAKVFQNETADLSMGTWIRHERLGWWTDSKGKALPDVPVRVEAGRSGGRVFALLCCPCLHS